MSEQRLFISHASEDGAQVARIVEYLEAQGVPCWISSRDIPPKSIYAEEITSAMRNAAACAVVVSEAANASAAIKRELELASRSNKPFIPIRIDATEPGPGLDYYLNNTQWMEYRRDGAHALDRIVAHMKGAPPPAAPARSQAPARRGGGALLAIGLVVVALAAGAGWVAWTQLGGDETELAATEPAQEEATQVPQSAEPTATAPAAPAIPVAGPSIAGRWEGVSRIDGAPQGVESALWFNFSEDGRFRGQIGGDVEGAWREENGVFSWNCGTRCWSFTGRVGDDGVFRGRMDSNNPGVPNGNVELRRAAG